MLASRKHTSAPVDPTKLDRLESLGLTKVQAIVFLILFETARQEGYQPTVRHMMDRMGYGNPNAIYDHLVALSRKGWIIKGNNSARCVKFLRTPSGAPFQGFICPEES